MNKILFSPLPTLNLTHLELELDFSKKFVWFSFQLHFKFGSQIKFQKQNQVELSSYPILEIEFSFG
jgi:hypothetical protein